MRWTKAFVFEVFKHLPYIVSYCIIFILICAYFSIIMKNQLGLYTYIFAFLLSEIKLLISLYLVTLEIKLICLYLVTLEIKLISLYLVTLKIKLISLPCDSESLSRVGYS